MSKWIAFEGIDGSGKTTQAKRLAKFLGAAYVREPGTKEIRKLTENEDLPKLAKLYLHLGDRAITMEQVWKELSFRDVVSDRSWFSQLAYQGYGDCLDKELIVYLNKKLLGGVEPDIVFYLDISPNMVYGKPGRFSEIDRLDYYNRVRNGYLQMTETYQNWVIIDGMMSEDEIFKVILGELGEGG